MDFASPTMTTELKPSIDTKCVAVSPNRQNVFLSHFSIAPTTGNDVARVLLLHTSFFALISITLRRQSYTIATARWNDDAIFEEGTISLERARSAGTEDWWERAGVGGRGMGYYSTVVEDIETALMCSFIHFHLMPLVMSYISISYHCIYSQRKPLKPFRNLLGRKRTVKPRDNMTMTKIGLTFL